jgi:hypothetical protein
MIHPLLYWLHIIGMISVILLALDLFFNGKFSISNKKSTVSILASISHTQLLIGFGLFMIKFREINHMKVGIKIVLAVLSAILFTMYAKKVKKDLIPSKIILLTGILLILVITAIAFLWK